jgi:hypothetical protein
MDPFSEAPGVTIPVEQAHPQIVAPKTVATNMPCLHFVFVLIISFSCFLIQRLHLQIVLLHAAGEQVRAIVPPLLFDYLPFPRLQAPLEPFAKLC